MDNIIRNIADVQDLSIADLIAILSYYERIRDRLLNLRMADVITHRQSNEIEQVLSIISALEKELDHRLTYHNLNLD